MRDTRHYPIHLIGAGLLGAGLLVWAGLIDFRRCRLFCDNIEANETAVHVGHGGGNVNSRTDTRRLHMLDVDAGPDTRLPLIKT